MEGHGDRRAWIGLNLTLTPRRIASLLDHFESAAAAWRAPLADLKRVAGFERAAEAFDRKRKRAPLDRELHAVERLGLRVLTLDAPDYPAALRAQAQPPPVLYARGMLAEADALSLAVVGTRRMSAGGRRATQDLVRELARAGLCIVSGLALGVDTEAHRAALAAGGRTLAVLGAGFGHLYPPENAELAEQIAAQGALLSEFPIHTQPARWTFPRRNRVISGLSLGTLVVEAPLKSGALITAKHALEQGREVFAVPGPIHSPNARGCHALIKDGAKLVERAQDVLEEFPELKTALRGPNASQPARPQIRLTGPERRVYECLGFEPVHLNDLCAKAEIPIEQASAILIQLEMQGLVSEAEPKHYLKRP